MTRAMHNPALLLLNDSPRLPLIAALAVRFAAFVTQWEQRRRSRVNLGRLDDRLLRDVGLTRHRASAEVSKYLLDEIVYPQSHLRDLFLAGVYPRPFFIQRRQQPSLLGEWNRSCWPVRPVCPHLPNISAHLPNSQCST